jgi:hypothetical protein
MPCRPYHLDLECNRVELGMQMFYVLVLPGKNFIDNDIEIVFWIGKSL